MNYSSMESLSIDIKVMPKGVDDLNDLLVAILKITNFVFTVKTTAT